MRKAVVPAAALLLVASLAAGCRQSDGVAPQPTGEQINKTDDISRDLLNVANRDRGAVDDLRIDLENLTEAPPPPDTVARLAAAVEQAIAGVDIQDAAAKELANRLFVATSARDLSGRQIERLKQDVNATLTAAGVAPVKADVVGSAVVEVQQAVTTNRSRWWHLR